MFSAAAGAGSLDVSLIYFRGQNECVASRWLSDPRSLSKLMSTVTCRAGLTQLGRVLRHAAKENQDRKVDALILISDSCEETPSQLYAQARELAHVPTFLFQEGHDAAVTEIFGEIARITSGAVATFDHSSAQRLADLLKAVVSFATGGVRALENQGTEAARLLLSQIKK
jgi:hypothetical protein